MLSVVTWKWGRLFGPIYANRLRSMFERHLHVPHRLICVTDDTSGIDPRVECLPPFPDLGLWERHRDSSCLQRMKGFDRAVESVFGRRFLTIDLDMILTADVTPLFDRPEPLVLWWCYANCFAGGLVLQDAGVLHDMWAQFRDDPGFGERARGADNLLVNRPERFVRPRYPRRATPPPRVVGDVTDQAILNYYVKGRVNCAMWQDSDGMSRYYHGWRTMFGPSLTEVPKGMRLIAFGHKELELIEQGAHPWIREHWR